MDRDTLSLLHRFPMGMLWGPYIHDSIQEMLDDGLIRLDEKLSMPGCGGTMFITAKGSALVESAPIPPTQHDKKEG